MNIRLTNREQYYLDLYKPYDPHIGYNILTRAYSYLGAKRSSKTIELLRKINSGENHPGYGKGKNVLQFEINSDKSTGKLIRSWISGYDAVKNIGNGVLNSHLLNHLKWKPGFSSYKGFIWKYETV